MKHHFSKIFFYTALLSSLSLNAFAEKEKLTVILDWFPNPDHAPLVIAETQGFFKKQGLEVQLIAPSDPTDPPKLVAAKKADIGITYEPDFIKDIDQGLPLLHMGTLIDKPLNCLVALDETGIKNLSDLKGKQIGASDSGFAKTLLTAMLDKAHLKDNEVSVINVHYNLTQSLLMHKVDAVTGLMRNFEVPQLENLGKKITVFLPEEHGIPNYSELIFIIHREKAQDKRFALFLNAIKEAVRYIDEHPKESWASFIKKYPEANNTVNKTAWFMTMPYFAEDPASFDETEWLTFANFMMNHHLIKKVSPIHHYTALATPSR